MWRNWLRLEKTAGHASTSASDKITKPIAASHPYISLNPNDPKVKNKPKDDEIKEMTKTIFHEQLHNLGIRHGEGIEYPYTCETCCLSNPKDDKDMVATACKVCAGQYDSTKKGKEAYLVDIVAWGEANYNSTQSSKSVINYLKENPKSQSGIIVLSRAFAGYFNPVGAEMAKLLKSKFPNLSKEDQANLDKALASKDEKHISSQSDKAKVIAEANIRLYYENDPAKTLSYLEANKSVLKSIVEQNKKPKNDLEKYTFDQMVTDSKKALVDIWLQNYPNNVDEAKSDKAYQILKETGFLK